MIGNMVLLSDGFNGSVMKNMKKSFIKKLQIPIPKTQEKLESIMSKITPAYANKMNELYQQYIKELSADAIKGYEFVKDSDKKKEDCEKKEVEQDGKLSVKPITRRRVLRIKKDKPLVNPLASKELRKIIRKKNPSDDESDD